MKSDYYIYRLLKKTAKFGFPFVVCIAQIYAADTAEYNKSETEILNKSDLVESPDEKNGPDINIVKSKPENGQSQEQTNQIVLKKSNIIIFKENAKKHENLVLFEDRWVSPSDYIRLEEQRYRKYRVASPIEIVSLINNEQLSSLSSHKQLTDTLMGILRVGDRIVIKEGSNKWVIWKRYEKLTNEFRKSTISIGKTNASTEIWSPDPIALHSVKIKPGKEALLEIALLLHRARNMYPHMDLQYDQLTKQGYTLKRNLLDGELTVVVCGGAAIKADEFKTEQYGDFSIIRISQGNSPVSLTWADTPKSILGISDKQISLMALPEKLLLLKNEKKSVQLSNTSKVSSFVRFTNGPNSKGWKQQEFNLSGPLGFQMDLSRDEVGPHDLSGEYQRIWIVQFSDGKDGVVTQRQTSMKYAVKGDEKEAISNEFIRR
jgi:hypothetical protein